MKFLPSQMMFFLQGRETKNKIRSLLKFIFLLSLLIIIYSAIFHFIMEYEGRRFTWITGLYWSLTVMSTLGFGDITFSGDLGKIFSIIVITAACGLISRSSAGPPWIATSASCTPPELTW
jgi:voltage-gated potassium channel